MFDYIAFSLSNSDSVGNRLIGFTAIEHGQVRRRCVGDGVAVFKGDISACSGQAGRCQMNTAVKGRAFYHGLAFLSIDTVDLKA